MLCGKTSGCLCLLDGVVPLAQKEQPAAGRECVPRLASAFASGIGLWPAGVSTV